MLLYLGVCVFFFCQRCINCAVLSGKSGMRCVVPLGDTESNFFAYTEVFIDVVQLFLSPDAHLLFAAPTS